jgi:hypothetical protein
MFAPSLRLIFAHVSTIDRRLIAAMRLQHSIDLTGFVRHTWTYNSWIVK